jgi:hypothetical protein
MASASRFGSNTAPRRIGQANRLPSRKRPFRLERPRFPETTATMSLVAPHGGTQPVPST